MSINSRHQKVKDDKTAKENKKLTTGQLQTLNAKLTTQAQKTVNKDFEPLKIDLENEGFKLEVALNAETMCTGECPTLKILKNGKDRGDINLMIGHQKDNNKIISDVYVTGYSFTNTYITRPYVIDKNILMPEPLTEDQFDKFSYFITETILKPLCINCRINNIDSMPPECTFYEIGEYNPSENTCARYKRR